MKRVAVALSLILLGVAGLAARQEEAPKRSPGEQSASAGSASVVAIVQITDVIDYRNRALIRRAVQKIKEMKPALVLFEIDTPGGRVDLTLAMGEDMMSLEPLRTASYVSTLSEGGAWSAGAFLAMSTKNLYMANGTVIGAAAPVRGDTGEMLPEKYVSATREKFRARAEQNGYPPNLAVAMVDVNHEVYEVEVEGKKRYLTWAEIEKLRETHSDLKVPSTPFDSKDTILTLTARQANEVGLAKLADSRQEIYADLGIASPVEVFVESTWSESLAGFLTSGLVSSILMMVGMIGLYVEIKTPGFGVTGAIAILALATLLFGHHLAGLAEAIEIVLIVAGIALLAVEIFVFPGMGVFAIGGVVCLLAGLVMTFQDFTLPDIKGAPWQLDILVDSVTRVLIGFAGATVAFLVIVRFLPKVPMANRLVLQTNVAATAPSAPGNTADLIGRKGHAMTPLRPGGKIRIEGEVYDVVAEGDFVAIGEPVKVLRLEGTTVIVGKSKR